MSIACFEWIQAFVIDPRWVQFDLKLIQNVIISSHLFIATLMHFYIPIQLLYHLYLKLIHVYNVLDNECPTIHSLSCLLCVCFDWSLNSLSMLR